MTFIEYALSLPTNWNYEKDTKWSNDNDTRTPIDYTMDVFIYDLQYDLKRKQLQRELPLIESLKDLLSMIGFTNRSQNSDIDILAAQLWNQYTEKNR